MFLTFYPSIIYISTKHTFSALAEVYLQFHFFPLLNTNADFLLYFKFLIEFLLISNFIRIWITLTNLFLVLLNVSFNSFVKYNAWKEKYMMIVKFILSYDKRLFACKYLPVFLILSKRVLENRNIVEAFIIIFDLKRKGLLISISLKKKKPIS